MTITTNRNENELTIALEGRLNTLTAPDLDAKLDEVLDGVEKLVFDLAELEYISSAGLRVLVSAYKVMQEQGEMVIRNAKPDIVDVFEVTGLDDLFELD